MLKVKKHGVILAPTKAHFEDKAVLNPGVWQEGDNLHFLYRAVNKKNISSFGYARFVGPTRLIERWPEPVLKPRYASESHGLEDPRITKIGDIFYVTFVVHDGKNALVAYAFGPDLFHLKHGGIIGPKIKYDRAGHFFRHSKIKDQYYLFEAYYEEYSGADVLLWEKDPVLFPEKINNKFVMLRRFLPDIQIAYFQNFKQLKDTKYWIDYLKHLGKHVVLESRHGFEERHVGGGAPPIKTKYGWLIIYHGVEEINKSRYYHAGAALLDLKNPQKIIARLPEPLFSPREDFEVHGQVSNVVFPTGTAIFKDQLYIYYGAADTHIAAASVNLNDLLKQLLKLKGDKYK